VVAISGIDSFQAMAGHGVLGGAKAAVESLVRAFALELGPAGVTVNAVNPGFVATDSSRLYLEQGLGRDFDDAMRSLAAATPVRRNGTVEDVADCVAWIASDGAGFLTGQVIVLDGGLTIVSPPARPARPPGRARPSPVSPSRRDAHAARGDAVAVRDHRRAARRAAGGGPGPLGVRRPRGARRGRRERGGAPAPRHRPGQRGGPGGVVGRPLARS